MKKRTLRFWITFIGILSVLSVILEKMSPIMPEIAYKLLTVSIFPFLYIFMFGMMVYNFREKLIPLFVKYKWAIIAIYTIWELLPDKITNCVYGVRYNTVTTLLLMCTVFAVGYGFGKHRVKTDYTFSFYLYHVVVINLVVELGITSISTPLVFITVFISELIAIMTLSYFSAHVIEKRVSNALLNKALSIRSIKNDTVKK